MINGTSCQPCNKTLKYCQTCSSDKTCTKCDNTTDLTVINGTCQCPYGNFSVFDETKMKCSCTNETYFKNKTCGRCTQLISGCDRCLFNLGQSSSGLKLDDGNSLQCSNCAYGNFLDAQNYKCVPCTTKFKGCALCGSLGTSCTKCLPTHLGTVSGSTLNCVPCGDYITGCKTCTSQTVCVDC